MVGLAAIWLPLALVRRFTRGVPINARARLARDGAGAAERASVPVFKSPLITMKFINLATLALEMMFAPRGTEMGSMVDILGVGVIIKGESGIGKSECVLALLERGYSLVADDITRVSLVDGRDVMGMDEKQLLDLRRHKVSMVFQNFGLFPHRRVIDLVGRLHMLNDGIGNA